MDLDEYRQNSLANWDKISANWESEREWIWNATGFVGDRIVDAADPQPGDTVLDIACGTGDTGFIAAGRIGDEGRLITTDFAPGMVEAARRNGESQGIGNAEYRVLDAEQMDLEDSSVDRVVSRWGYMLMADPAKALTETRRVLREDGKLGFAVWDTPDKNLWAAIPGMTLVERGLFPPPEPGTPGIFAMGEQDRIRELVTGAGFGEPEIETVAIKWPYEDVAEHWHFTLKLAGPLADAIQRQSDEDQESIRVAVAEKIEPLIEAGGMSGSVHVVTAS